MTFFAGVGRVLREVRLERRWTQEQLARRAGVSKSMISLYEMGRQRPQLDTLEKLLRALGVGVAELGRRLESRRFGGPEAASPWLLRGTAGREPSPRLLPPLTDEALTEILHAMEGLLRRALHSEPAPPREETDDAVREAPTPRKSGGGDTVRHLRG